MGDYYTSGADETVIDLYERWSDKRWDVWLSWNPWLSLGVHIDHTDPSIALHLPGTVVHIGRLGIVPGWSLRRRSSPVARKVRHGCDGARVEYEWRRKRAKGARDAGTR